MIGKTERQLDLEHLEKLHEEGKVEKQYMAEIADLLPKWRESSDVEDKQNLVIYGRDSDLDQLVKSKNWRVRVAKHGRGKDLDILVHDPDQFVRQAVAGQGQGRDLDILVHDPNKWVRWSVARQGRKKDLEILANDTESLVLREVLGKN